MTFLICICYRPDHHPTHPQPPLSTPERRGLCGSPPPHPGSPSIHTTFLRFNNFSFNSAIFQSMHNVIPLTIYNNTSSASYKYHPKIICNTPKNLTSKIFQSHSKLFQGPRYLQQPANATNSASMEFWFTLFTVNI